MALTITCASVIASSAAQWDFKTAGGTITRGQPIAVQADGTVVAANANAGSTILPVAIGISMSDVGSGQRCYYVTRDPSFTHGILASEIAPGQPVYLDDTAGGMTVTYSDIDAADYATLIGQINNAETTMNLLPQTPVLKAAS